MKKFCLLLTVLSFAFISQAQVYQLFWSNGEVIYSIPLDSFDSVSYVVAEEVEPQVLKLIPEDEQDYVDLGLPSGTLWKKQNEEKKYYKFYQIRELLPKLPTADQFDELRGCCTWRWTGNGYEVVGRNGNSIFLPAEGEDNCQNNIVGIGVTGNYWTSTIHTPYDRSYCLTINKDGFKLWDRGSCHGFSLRLVKNAK